MGGLVVWGFCVVVLVAEQFCFYLLQEQGQTQAEDHAVYYGGQRIVSCHDVVELGVYSVELGTGQGCQEYAEGHSNDGDNAGNHIVQLCVGGIEDITEASHQYHGHKD